MQPWTASLAAVFPDRQTLIDLGEQIPETTQNLNTNRMREAPNWSRQAIADGRGSGAHLSCSQFNRSNLALYVLRIEVHSLFKSYL